MEKGRKSLMQSQYKSYLKSEMYNLKDAYGKFSNKKKEAFEYCRSLQDLYDRQKLRVISASCWIFTVGFIGIYEEKECFFYITKDNDYYIELEELNGSNS